MVSNTTHEISGGFGLGVGTNSSFTSVSTNTAGSTPAGDEPKKVFSRTLVYQCIRRILKEYFQDKTYSEADVKDWIRDITRTIMQKLHAFKFFRYKFVVHVTIAQIVRKKDGSIASPHCNHVSGLWDLEKDKMTMYTFFNETIYCLVNVCGIYKY